MAAPTLDDVKAQLNITGSGDDAELQFYLDAAQSVVESKVGSFASETVTETVCASGSRLMLNRLPLLSVTSLTATAPGTTTYATADLSWNTASGIVRLAGGGSLAGEWVATYTTGLADVPADVALATLLIVAHLWETQRGPSAPAGALPSDVLDQAVGVGYLVPRRALELLNAHTLPGF